MQPLAPSSVATLGHSYYHSLVVDSGGNVWASGYNNHGQLGDGTTTGRSTPVQVPGLQNMLAVAGGAYHSLALRSDGTVWAWGSNVEGELGDGTTTDRLAPIQVPSLSSVVAITADGFTSFAVKSDGTLWAWGQDFYGEVGDGTTGVLCNGGTRLCRPTPVQSLISGVSAAAGGADHTLALKTDGTLWAWGRNNSGQLGDGTTTTRLSPAQVNLSGVRGMSAGIGYSLAVRSDGRLRPGGTTSTANWETAQRLTASRRSR